MSNLNVKKEFQLKNKSNRSAFSDKNAAYLAVKKQRLGVGIGANNKVIQKPDFLKVVLKNVINASTESVEWTKLVNNYLNSFILIIPSSGYNITLDYKYNSVPLKEVCETRLLELESDLAKELETNPSEHKKIYKRFYDDLFDYYTTFIIGKITIFDATSYFIYCYMLEHYQVANREEDANNSNRIEYVLYDTALRVNRELDMFKLANKVSRLYLEVIESETNVDNLLLVFGEDIRKYTSLDQKALTLKNYSTINPSNFIRVFSDKFLIQRAFIEKAVLFGLLKRLPASSIITDTDNTILGQNVEEVISYLVDAKNTAFVEKLVNALKAKNK